MSNIKEHQQQGYDRHVGVFSPDGIVLQVEYAEKAVNLGSPVLSLVFNGGIVTIAYRKINSKLLIEESFKKIFKVQNNITITGAGISSDCRRLIEQTQLISQEHKLKYQEDIDVLALTKDVANIQQYYSQSGGVRPFGVSLLINSYENKKFHIYQTTPSGIYLKFRALCIGRSSDKINEILEDKYDGSLDEKKALKLGFDCLKKTSDIKFSENNFDVVILTKDSIKRLNKFEIKKIL